MVLRLGCGVVAGRTVKPLFPILPLSLCISVTLASFSLWPWFLPSRNETEEKVPRRDLTWLTQNEGYQRPGSP